MSIIGFNFEKISVERKKVPQGEIKISNNVRLTDVREEKINVGEAHKALKVGFEYKLEYGSDTGNLMLTGNVIYLDDKKKQDSIIEAWNAKKPLDTKFSLSITNTVLAKCNIKAIELCSEVNLPTHIAMPVAKPKGAKTAKESKESSYIG